MSTTPAIAGVHARNGPLDGLRGLGTWFVMMAHLGIASWWWPGLAGVLAVSMFFTLSGYLIATGLLRQIDRDGRIGWRRFYARRARRLLPTATVAVAVFTCIWWVTGRSLGTREVVASLTYWKNWHAVATTGGYDEVFREASPFQHFWSLAIEEQFYVVMPALLVGLMLLLRRRHGRVAIALAALALGSFALGGVYDASSRGRAYYGTEVRAGEFLIGVLLAVALTTPDFRRRLERMAATRTASWLAGVLAVVSLVFWWRVGYASPGLFPYLLPLNSLITAGLIAYFVTPRARGFSTVLFGWRPVVAIGRRSYSIYVAHWPIFLLLDQPGPARLGESLVKLVVALAGGFLLFHLVEDPVQRSVTWRTPPRLAMGLVSTTVAAIAVVMVANVDRETPLVDVEAIDRQQDQFFDDLDTIAPITTTPAVTTTGAPPTSAPATDPDDSGAPPETFAPPSTPPAALPETTATTAAPALVERVLLVGDSNGWTASGWLEEHPELLPWTYKWWAGTGCGTTGDTSTRARNEADGVLCPGWLSRLGDAVDAYRPDVVLVVSFAGDLAEHDLGDGTWRTIGDPEYETFLVERMGAFVDLVTPTGARVGWFSQPDYAVTDNRTQQLGSGLGWAMNDPAAIARLNEMITALAERDDRVVRVPYREWALSWPGGQFDRDFRPDGVHLDGRREDVGRWIMAQVDLVAGLPSIGADP